MVGLGKIHCSCIQPDDTMSLSLKVHTDGKGLRSGWSLVPDVPALRGTTHREGSHTRVDKRKVLIGCLSWHMLLCRDDAHTISIWMVWVKCTTSVECKSVRIAECSVMDDWDDHYLAQCWFCFKNVFKERWKGDGSEYSWCTTIKMEKF
jgi:hypothetical protein